MTACEPPSVSVCEELRIWEPSKQEVKKEMPPGSRKDQRCTNSFSYKMEFVGVKEGMRDFAGTCHCNFREIISP